MWKIKIIIPSNENMLIGSRAKKFKINIMGYPLSNYWKNNRFYLFGSVYLVGDQASKKAFLKDMKKDKRTVKIDMSNENFGFWLIEQHPSAKIFHHPMIIYPKPLVVAENGDYIFELASWNKGLLNKIVNKVDTNLYNGRLIYFKNSKIDNIHIISMAPNLTEKQKRALEIAIQYGYYGYPRKIEIDRMAKMMHISYSTFQFHLRNAEKKIIPFIHDSV